MYWLGIDGGGTKTAFTAYDDNLCTLARVVLPTCHYAQAGFNGMERILTKGITQIEAEVPRFACASNKPYGIGIGMCGYGEGIEVTHKIDEIVERVVGTHPFVLVNDVEAAWAAGLETHDGVVIIAGTGSIAYGVIDGCTARCGGWDYELGDEGSGGWMGKELLRSFTREADGRAAAGPLLELVRQTLKLEDDFDVIAYAQQNFAHRSTISKLAPLVSKAAEAGDAEALGILERAAQEEATLVRALIKRLTDPTKANGAHANASHIEAYTIPVTYIGGTFRAGNLILNPLRRALPHNCTLVAPLHEPDVGAVLLLRKNLETTS